MLWIAEEVGLLWLLIQSMLAAAAVDQKQKGGDRESCRTGSEYMMGGAGADERTFRPWRFVLFQPFAHLDLGTKSHFDLRTKWLVM